MTTDAPRGWARRVCLLLWTLFALFVARVAGQFLVVFVQVRFLPPREAWCSGLMSYEFLLPSQVVIIALMAKVCVDFTRGRGFFFEPKRFFATVWLWFGYLYLASMIVRAVLLWDRPIPIVLHWVLAAFVITVGLSHLTRLRLMKSAPRSYRTEPSGRFIPHTPRTRPVRRRCRTSARTP